MITWQGSISMNLCFNESEIALPAAFRENDGQSKDSDHIPDLIVY